MKWWETEESASSEVGAVMWDDYNGMHDGYWGGWLVLVLLFVLLVGLAAILVLVLLRGPGHGAAGDRTRSAEAEAERILRQRFATGEIDEDEFRRRLDALSEHVGPRCG